jgi:signal-transduction protein with cAMP-binding, CBS, and nucleotidyltransferase domain
VYVNLRQTSDECMALMTAKRIRHLPVMEGSKVMGVLSIGDLVRDVIEEQQIAINELQRYIHG